MGLYFGPYLRMYPRMYHDKSLVGMSFCLMTVDSSGCFMALNSQQVFFWDPSNHSYVIQQPAVASKSFTRLSARKMRWNEDPNSNNNRIKLEKHQVECGLFQDSGSNADVLTCFWSKNQSLIYLQPPTCLYCN